MELLGSEADAWWTNGIQSQKSRQFWNKVVLKRIGLKIQDPSSLCLLMTSVSRTLKINNSSPVLYCAYRVIFRNGRGDETSTDWIVLWFQLNANEGTFSFSRDAPVSGWDRPSLHFILHLVLVRTCVYQIGIGYRLWYRKMEKRDQGGTFLLFYTKGLEFPSWAVAGDGVLE